MTTTACKCTWSSKSNSGKRLVVRGHVRKMVTQGDTVRIRFNVLENTYGKPIVRGTYCFRQNISKAGSSERSDPGVIKYDFDPSDAKVALSRGLSVFIPFDELRMNGRKSKVVLDVQLFMEKHGSLVFAWNLTVKALKGHRGTSKLPVVVAPTRPTTTSKQRNRTALRSSGHSKSGTKRKEKTRRRDKYDGVITPTKIVVDLGPHTASPDVDDDDERVEIIASPPIAHDIPDRLGGKVGKKSAKKFTNGHEGDDDDDNDTGASSAPTGSTNPFEYIEDDENAAMTYEFEDSMDGKGSFTYVPGPLSRAIEEEESSEDGWEELVVDETRVGNYGDAQMMDGACGTRREYEELIPKKSSTSTSRKGRRR